MGKAFQGLYRIVLVTSSSPRFPGAAVQTFRSTVGLLDQSQTRFNLLMASADPSERMRKTGRHGE
jgi:hypothetical protein